MKDSSLLLKLMLQTP